MALFAEDVPEHHGAGRVLELDAELLGAFGHLGVVAAGAAEAGEITLHVGHEDGHADVTQALRDDAKRDSLSGTGGTSNEPVAVRHLRQERNVVVGLGQRQRFGHAGVLALPRPTSIAKESYSIRFPIRSQRTA